MDKFKFSSGYLLVLSKMWDTEDFSGNFSGISSNF
jgi:hypothetical protein